MTGVRLALLAGTSFLGALLLGAATPDMVGTVSHLPVAPKENPASSDRDQQIKCRKYTASGSLVRKVKMCRTIAEWRKAAQAGNDAAREIAGENLCSGGECRGFEPPDGAPQ